MKEMGSEYWLNRSNTISKSNSFEKLMDFGDDQQLLYSGRTAIDYVLEDIDRLVSNVYMPSYCCDSMLQPFFDRNIKIEFYEILPRKEGIKYNIDYTKKIDIFFATSYFGCNITNMDNIIEKIKSKNTIVIEDITHRLLCEQYFCEKADYNIASLRKWFAIPSGGLAVKQNGVFKNIELSVPPKEMMKKKVTAMTKKAIYMENKTVDSRGELNKNEFLNLFSEFNSNLSANYKGYSIDDKSKELLKHIDIQFIKITRRENIRHIYENLNCPEGVSFLFSNPDFEHDCLLFVPLLINENIRDHLRKYLISNSIYCPVHWPIPSAVIRNGGNIELYNKELSLICDQRYQLSDVDKMLTKVGEFNK